jgi:hypothetical protein
VLSAALEWVLPGMSTTTSVVRSDTICSRRRPCWLTSRYVPSIRRSGACNS